MAYLHHHADGRRRSGGKTGWIEIKARHQDAYECLLDDGVFGCSIVESKQSSHIRLLSFLHPSHQTQLDRIIDLSVFDLESYKPYKPEPVRSSWATPRPPSALASRAEHGSLLSRLVLQIIVLFRKVRYQLF
jgi:hypothetical protein